MSEKELEILENEEKEAKEGGIGEERGDCCD